MRWPQWLALIGGMVGLGCLQVSQHNAVFLNAYAVGERLERVRTRQTEVARLQADVEGLASPSRLTRVAQERHLTLVAWSTLSPRTLLAATAPQEPDATGPDGTLVHVASAGPPGADTSD